MLMPDRDDQWRAVVGPWSPHRDARIINGHSQRIFSYGQDGYSYTLRLGTTFKVPNPYKDGLVDPKHLQDDDFIEVEAEVHPVTDERYIVIPPQSFVLGNIVEYLDIPPSHLALFFGKSSYGRVGINPYVTPGEPGWRGDLVVEICNNWPGRPVKVYCNEGILAMVLLRGEQPCRTTYEDRQGRYQNQQGIQVTR